MSTRTFTPDLFAFLKDLSVNNDRTWFHENKERYEHAVREPALDFIEAFRPRLEGLSPHFEANARAVGGSLFRIQRDTRFSKDKTPYKTNSGVHFRHERSRDAHAPGFYLHLEPGGSFMGIGIWRPEPKVAQQIRMHIGEHRPQWIAATSSPDFQGRFDLAGDSLVRPPKGFDKDDPLIADLKRKDFIATTKLTQKEVTAASFADDFEQVCQTGLPYMRFLCEALDVEF